MKEDIDLGVLVLMHEVSHNLVYKETNPKGPKNRLLGILCNSVMLVPISEVCACCVCGWCAGDFFFLVKFFIY